MVIEKYIKDRLEELAKQQDKERNKLYSLEDSEKSEDHYQILELETSLEIISGGIMELNKLLKTINKEKNK